MESVRSSETSIHTYHITRCRNSRL